MSPVQQYMANRNKRFVIATAVITGGLWIALVFYVMIESQNVHVTAQPGAVAVHAPSPVVTVNSSSAHFRHSTPTLLQHSAPSPYTWTLLPSTTPMSGTSTMRIHQTSDAAVHSVGGGGSGSGIATTSGRNSSRGRGITYTSVAYSGAIYVPVVSNALTPVGALEAGDVSQQKLGAPQRRVRTTDDGEYPEDRPDPVEDETPIGDVAWGLMLLLTTAWCVRVRLRRQ